MASEWPKHRHHPSSWMTPQLASSQRRITLLSESAHLIKMSEGARNLSQTLKLVHRRLLPPHLTSGKVRNNSSIRMATGCKDRTSCRPIATCLRSTRTKWPCPSSSNTKRGSESKKSLNFALRSTCWPIKWLRWSKLLRSWSAKRREMTMLSFWIRLKGRISFWKDGDKKSLKACSVTNGTSFWSRITWHDITRSSQLSNLSWNKLIMRQLYPRIKLTHLRTRQRLKKKLPSRAKESWKRFIDRS